MLGPMRNKNSIRLEYQESRRQEVTRDYVVLTVVKKILEMGPEEILCLYAFGRLGVYELCFRSAGGFAAAVVKLNENSKDEVLKGVRFELCGSNYCVIIQMYNAYVREEDLVTFLMNYSWHVSAGVKINDKHGLWTGKWRFYIQPRRGEGGRLHLPSRVFALGSDKGRLFIPEIPESAACWACGVMGHLSKDYSVKKCTSCYEMGHYAKDCPAPKLCNLCFQASHLFKACPKRSQSYAGVVSRPGGSRGSSAHRYDIEG